MISSEEFIDILKIAKTVPNYYNNKFPKNLGYYDGSKYSFDCWNLIKVCLSGWVPDILVGSYIKPDKLVTGDVDGLALLKTCTNRSKDFSKISVPGTYLYLSTSPHSGIYIGDTQINGDIYNVIECTKNMYAGQNGVTYSYVDKNGNRKISKNSNAIKGKWTDYGLLTKYVNYSKFEDKAISISAEASIEPKSPKLNTLQIGSEGADVKYLQDKLTSYGYSTKGIDGIFGSNTKKAVIAFQKNEHIETDGIVGPITWEHIEYFNKKDSTEFIYTVKKGDTLGQIAKDNKVSISSILKLNPSIKDPDKISVGDKIRIK